MLLKQNVHGWFVEVELDKLTARPNLEVRLNDRTRPCGNRHQAADFQSSGRYFTPGDLKRWQEEIKRLDASEKQGIGCRTDAYYSGQAMLHAHEFRIFVANRRHQKIAGRFPLTSIRAAHGI